ncbi:hypothetical protein DAC15_95 [Bacteroides phage DAC15]|jgi:hypothetical protein|uniref:hypothetical protein n=1 Tax=Bacteroides phage DAC15 TaxID=2710495 RepID=UPI001BE6E31D|nr:hypothetical protein KNU90_gp044 [Bacteroides phage DAC15]QIN96274.1 hypothetical protein DAC15_95 [Bacteroides phage DAC15]QIN96391.1 hypothetical protein DAC17_92 [Bacteroides phage DAC17]
MTRDEVVKLVVDCFRGEIGFINPSIKKDIIVNYCVKRGKNPQMSVKFVQLLSMSGPLLNQCFLDALEVLSKEHNVNILYDLRKAPNRVLSVF